MTSPTDLCRFVWCDMIHLEEWMRTFRVLVIAITSFSKSCSQCSTLCRTQATFHKTPQQPSLRRLTCSAGASDARTSRYTLRDGLPPPPIPSYTPSPVPWACVVTPPFHPAGDAAFLQPSSNDGAARFFLNEHYAPFASFVFHRGRLSSLIMNWRSSSTYRRKRYLLNITRIITSIPSIFVSLAHPLK